MHVLEAGQVENAEPEAGEPPHFTEEVTVTVHRPQSARRTSSRYPSRWSHPYNRRSATAALRASRTYPPTSLASPFRTSVPARARSRCAASRPRSCATSRASKEQVGVYLDESVISLSLFTPDHRGPARPAGHPVWIGLALRHGALHHEPAGDRRDRSEPPSSASARSTAAGSATTPEVRRQRASRAGGRGPRHRLQFRHRRLHRRRAAADECQAERCTPARSSAGRWPRTPSPSIRSCPPTTSSTRGSAFSTAAGTSPSSSTT